MREIKFRACRQCGIKTKNRVFCSKGCYYQHKRENEYPSQFKVGHLPLDNAFGKGDKHSQEAKGKVSKSLFGKRRENARNWQGGKTAEHILIRYSTEMERWREAIFRRDNYTCQECGARSGNGKTVILHADHIKPFAFYPKLRLDLHNGRTLCTSCHKKTDTFAGKAVRNYA